MLLVLMSKGTRENQGGKLTSMLIDNKAAADKGKGKGIASKPQPPALKQS
jgi:hypothetical protein